MDLEPIDPQTAIELYLADRENELTEATQYSHRSRLGHFQRWCEKNGIENLNELTGRVLQEYRLWRRAEGDLAPPSEKSQMDTIRVFVRWLESIDAVETDLHSKVRSPTLTVDENTRDVMLGRERAEQILDYLEKFEYASRPHVTLALMYHTMLRISGIRTLDCRDYDAQEQSLQVVHRPEEETPVKNAESGERFIALSGEICGLLDDWLSERRPSKTDEYGRRPLIATPQGRVARSTLRRDCYQFTRPCTVTGECPHSRDIDDCEATEHGSASKCPSSVSPHALRRGGITYALSQDWPVETVSSRASVSQSVLDDHYDRRSAREKMEQRRKFLDKL